ncbi:filamentous hemagglutinin outer membrane protein [Calothrix sp. NIES-4101]|nr:filamentous hemagglutinin outer membrane protein [Calothrix sp. NIES-4101]
MNQVANSLGKLFTCGFLIFAAPTLSVTAQITPDNTLGTESSRLDTNVLINNVLGDKINGGAQRDRNLFHSFSEFNINDGQRVYFSNPSGVINILTRVTGGNASNILGTLGVDGNANLFLMNPNGIFFGQNASLDVRGSFVGTTASSMKFSDGKQFSAISPQDSSLLTVSVPIGLQFNAQTSPITIQGNRDSGATGVPLGTFGSTLAMIGGDVILDGSYLLTLDGNIQLAAVATDSIVEFNVNNSLLDFNFLDNTVRSPITVKNRAFIAAIGDSKMDLFGGIIGLNNSSILGLDGASISINANQFNFENNAGLVTTTQGTPKAGDITIQASDFVNISSGTFSSASIEPATGDGGDITINARNIRLSGDGTANRGTLRTFTNGQGKAGNITLNALDTVNIDGGIINIASRGTGNTGDLTIRSGNGVNVDKGAIGLSSSVSGATGNLNIETGTLRLVNTNPAGGITVIGSNSGSTGSIFIQARNAVAANDSSIFTGVNLGGTGKVGNISIETQRLQLRDGAGIKTETYGTSNAGDITIKAGESVEITGLSPSELPLVSSISSSTGLGSTGQGGDITIATPQFVASQGGFVTTSSLNSSGNAGDITIRSQDVTIDGFVIIPKERFANNSDIPANGLPAISTLSSEVLGSNAETTGGTVTVETERLRLHNGGKVNTSVTQGTGKGGTLVVRATKAIDITGAGPILPSGFPSPSGLFADLQTGGIGSGGLINVETGTLRMSGVAQITASTLNQGNAGEVVVRANQIEMRGDRALISTSVNDTAIGNAGNLTVNTQKLKLEDGAQILSATFGNGNSGNLTVQGNVIEITGENSGLYSSIAEGANGEAGNINIGSDSLTISDVGVISSSIGENAQGKAGDININTGSLLIGEAGGIFANTRGRGNAGNITVNAREQIVINGGGSNDLLAGIGTNVGTPGNGKGGDIQLRTPSLSLLNGGSVAASTAGQGDAGNISINASDRILLDGVDPFGYSSVISVATTDTARGNGGELKIDTNSLSISNGAYITARTGNTGSAGNITINAKTFAATNGGQIISTTTGSGSAGNITINANSAKLAGIDANYSQRLQKFGRSVVFNQGAASGLYANTTLNASGKGGTISLNTGELNILDGARVSVDSLGSQEAGDININSGVIKLDNNSAIAATTNSSDGGNIKLTANDFLLLRRGSSISTTAGLAEAGGNGGNITIDTPFIVAVLKENSDITANAFTGNGGKVNITSQGIFGIAPAASSTSESDITASSRLGIQGQVTIQKPDVDPTKGIIELPNEVVDATNQLSQLCPRGYDAFIKPLSSFTITGRDALPLSPLEPLQGTATIPLATLDNEGNAQIQERTNNTSSLSPSPHLRVSPSPSQIIEAQGLVKNSHGEIFLVAQAPQTTPSSQPTVSACLQNYSKN